ncbi:hypothetical protein [Lacticaseibacillus kribbianus]|uniref:hypothetical protein n=1 Tax=Lacticaseibacillus kribbianus TaxID=2926292 RepID=UPI001CD2DE9D|nr:hypothetical protein [Lacticaseibacillus kribbianus]
MNKSLVRVLIAAATVLAFASGVDFALTSNETAAEATPTHVSAVSARRAREAAAAKASSQTETKSVGQKHAATAAKPADVTKATAEPKATTATKQSVAATEPTASKPAANHPAATAATHTAATATASRTTQAAPRTASAPAAAKPTTQAATTTVTRRATPVRRAAAPVATTGFTIGGRTFGIRTFNGVGQVPGDSYVYQWTAVANHYLIEYTGAAHAYLAGVGIGSAVSVNGHVYHVRKVSYSVANDQAGVISMLAQKRATGGISFQTCVPNGTAIPPLNIYYAN